MFRELVRVPELIKEVNFSLEVLLIDEEENRIDDGRGNWRRRGVSIKDRTLIGVNTRILFENSIDFLKLLPEELREAFTNKELARSKKVSVRTAQQITYRQFIPTPREGSAPADRISLSSIALTTGLKTPERQKKEVTEEPR